jgi:anaerobic selenocysteine-containing dehydrogenase
MAFTTEPGADGDHVTYCRVCEAFCGMVATVEDGKIVKVRPDRDNPHSRGHICVKGPALADVTYDPDRITQPLRRVGGPGEFEPVSWDEALEDIAARFSASVEEHGAHSFAMNSGNPPSMGWPSSTGTYLFSRAMECTKLYSPSSEDITSVVLATELMFGTHAFVFPDLVDCDHLLIFGSNPLVSHGSLIIAPRLKEDLTAIAERGRVIVVDPRRTETARKFEHLSIMPAGDVWLLGAMVHTIIAEGLQDRAFVEAHCSGWDEMVAAIAWLTPEVAASRCGIAAEEIRTLAREFVAVPRAAAMGRIGICRAPYSTLTNFYLHLLNVIGGKFHRRGGVGWGHGGTATDAQSKGPGQARHKRHNSRVSGQASVWGTQSSLTFLEEMTTPGEGQIRSLLIVGANPVLSMPGGPRLPDGFAELDLIVAVDLYMTESSRYADYILPATTALEREDINQFFMNHMVRPFAQYVPAVVPPTGEARGEYEILRELADRMGRGAAFGTLTPFEMADAALQAGVEGRDGLSLAKLKANPHGLMIERGRWAFDFEKRIGHEDGKIHLWGELMAGEALRLGAEPEPDPDNLRLINIRKLRSINSWMHNVDKLVRSDAPRLLINPVDAATRQIDDGMTVSVSTEWGAIDVVAEVTDEVRPGCVGYPHGWGHRGGWRGANLLPGANLNAITPATADQAEQISGMSWLEGFTVNVRAA